MLDEPTARFIGGVMPRALCWRALMTMIGAWHSTGFAMFSKSPHSAWHSDDLDAKIGPLWGEKDEKKRIQGWKDVDRYIAEQGYILPLLQYAQPILYKSDLKVTPNVSGALQPTLVAKS